MVENLLSAYARILWKVFTGPSGDSFEEDWKS